MVNDVTKAPAGQAVNLKEVGQFAEWWANPSVIGLMGFSLTTIATGASDAFGFGATATIALALAFGGTAQFVAGWIDLRKGSIFGGSAFVSYGAFWWAIALIDWLLPLTGFKVPEEAKLAFFGCWTLFTLSFCLAVSKVGKALSILFWLLFIAFILLDLVVMKICPPTIAGYEIILTGLVAWYIATATLVNATHGKKVLPLA
jgi:succinate-acetate transporter protein